MLTPQRRQIFLQFVINLLAVVAQSLKSLFQVDHIPKDDGRYHQIQTAGPVPLVLKATVPHFTQSVVKHRPSQGVLGFTLV